MIKIFTTNFLLKGVCLGAVAVFFSVLPVQAQLGNGWIQYSPTKVVHLDDVAGLQTFSWTSYKSVCSDPICADYTYESATTTETFRIFDSRSNRSEIRLQNDYSTGSRQFEGYVTFNAPLHDESLMQIFGSSEGATQLMIRGYSTDGGSIRGAGKTLATGIYGKELRINVIHLQEAVGNKIIIYVDGIKAAEMADNEAVSNYHKYGCYGTTNGNVPAVVKWRNVKSFRDGTEPTGAPPAPGNLTATTTSATQINLSWTDNTNNEDNFVIERSTDGSNWSTLNTVTANVTNYTDAGLSAPAVYYYRVSASNALGTSTYSNVASAATSTQTLINVALYKPVTFSLESEPGVNPAAHAVDDNVTTRWSAKVFPQWLEVDLGAVYDISRTELVSYDNRAYRFTIQAKIAIDSSYVTIVDRSTNTLQGSAVSPITDIFTPVLARYVKIASTGVYGYTGDWTSYNELRIFGTSTPGAPVGIPTGLTAVAISSDQIDLRWKDNADNENYFSIERSSDGITWSPLTTRTANTTTYSNTGLTASTIYYYRVFAANASDSSAWSNVASITTQPPPSTPTELSAVAVTSSKMKLTWKDNANSESNFKIDRSPDGSAWSALATVAANTTIYYDSMLNAFTTYYYRIRATNAFDSSAYSNVASATTPGPPAAPSELTSVAVSSSQINLSWKDNANNEDNFIIERSSDGSTWSALKTVGANTITYSDIGLSASTTYYYRLQSRNAFGNSYSNVSNATTAIVTNVENPMEMNMFDAFPNPSVNGKVEIRYVLTAPGYVKITVNNVNGQVTATMVNQYQPAGRYEKIWDVSNIPGGLYVIQLIEGKRSRSIKIRVRQE